MQPNSMYIKKKTVWCTGMVQQYSLSVTGIIQFLQGFIFLSIDASFLNRVCSITSYPGNAHHL